MPNPLQIELERQLKEFDEKFPDITHVSCHDHSLMETTDTGLLLLSVVMLAFLALVLVNIK